MSDFNSVSDSFLGCLLGIALLFVAGLLFSLPVMWLWNWLMPMIFGLPTLTWIEAWGVNILCGLLFKPTVNVNKNS